MTATTAPSKSTPRHSSARGSTAVFALALIVRRVLGIAAGALIATFIVFAGMWLAPGSPLGFLTGGRSLEPEFVAALNERYNLDDPLPIAYLKWLGALLQGDLGESVISRESVWNLILPRLGTTMFLVGYALILIVLIGVGIGMISAIRPRVGTFLMGGATVAMAIPMFVSAMVLIAVFGQGLGWFPVMGGGSGFLGRIEHLTLPAFALALTSCAYLARVTRAEMAREMGSEYVETARVRGLSERQVIFRHAFRNTLIPVTTVSGMSAAALIAGTAIVETAFGISGIGAYLVTAVTQKDFPVVQALVLLIVLAFLIINTLVDALYALIDPRLTRGAQ